MGTLLVVGLGMEGPAKMKSWEKSSMVGIDFRSRRGSENMEKWLRVACPEGTVITGTVVKEVHVNAKGGFEAVYAYSVAIVWPIGQEQSLAMVGHPPRGYEPTEEEKRSIQVFNEGMRKCTEKVAQVRVSPCGYFCVESALKMLEVTMRAEKASVFGEQWLFAEMYRVAMKMAGIPTYEGREVEVDVEVMVRDGHGH